MRFLELELELRELEVKERVVDKGERRKTSRMLIYWQYPVYSRRIWVVGHLSKFFDLGFVCCVWIIDLVGFRFRGSVWECRLKRVPKKFKFFFFAKILYGLYVLDRFNVLMSKIIFKKWKNIIDMHFGMKSYLKSTRNHTAKHCEAYVCLYI